MEPSQQPPPQQQPPSGIPGPTGRRLHIAHRRSPSELTPLMSMFSTPGMEQLAIQQQIELLQQQQQAIQQTHQQYVNMGMIPPTQHLAPAGAFNPLQPQMHNMNPQNFQFPPQLPQQQMNAMGPPAQPLGHRRNQSAMPGPPPAPSSGAAGTNFGEPNIQGQGRENIATRGGRGGASGDGHRRRHSLALPEAKKAAEMAQQKRTTSGFQFPIPGGGGATPTSADRTESPLSDERNTQSSNHLSTPSGSFRGRGGTHIRSQSMAVGHNGRPMNRSSFQSLGEGQGADFGRRASHNRTSSRNFEGNWRNQVPQNQNQEQGQNHSQGFQPGHRSRGSVNQQSISSLGNFQYGGQPQLVQLPQGGVALLPQPMYPGQQLNAMQMNQLQALQASQLNGHGMVGLQGSQHAPGMSGQQQQQRKTLFTPYLPQATLPALLADGQLVSGILRVNKKNRSDAYVTTVDGLLDADIFICGSKDRNRALEGDLVAVELLDVDEVWSQKREKEEKKKRKDITDTRTGSTNGNDKSATNGDGQDSNADGTIRRRGSLRQRPTQKKNDDVEVEGQSLLLVDEEEVNDEQKPLYAGHIVAVIERVAGQMFSGTLGLLRPSSQATKEKQEAERAARDGGSSRHQEPRHQDKPKIVWFKPTDKRVPLIAIPTEQAPRDFVEKHQEYADRIFVACIKRWPITSLHPFGTLVEQLGKMGDLRVETDALLRDNNFTSDEFSDAVLRTVGLENWSLEKEGEASVAARRDFRAEKAFTIDPDGASELDGAIHIKSIPDGKIEIGYHVADVTHFVKANSLVDREAKKRGTAVHLMNRTCSMLPPKLAAEVCSFVPGEDRLAFSVVFNVNQHTGAISDDVWIGKSIVKSSGKLTYAAIDEALSGSFDASAQGPDAQTIQILYAVTQNFREARLSTEGESMAPLRLLHQLDDENVPVVKNIFDSTLSRELMEELAHKVNHFVAQKLLQGLPEKALLRRQTAPNPRRLQTFADRMNRLGYDIDTTSSGTLQNSLFRVDDDGIRQGMETLLVKSMQHSKYFIAGKTAAALHPNYALNLPVYTHFTNPSRRYADIVVHRQLEAVLAETEYAEDIESLVKTTESCNTKKDSAQNAQEQSVHIEQCRMMDKAREAAGGELISEGVVICVYESAFDVLIPEFGFEKRVHCDQLPLKKAEFRKKERVLELYWEKGVTSSAYVPEDERPKAGLSQRQVNAAAAAREAAVAERARREREEAARKQTETGTISTDDVDALFDDEEDGVSDISESVAGVSLVERPTQSVPPSPTKSSLTAAPLHRTRSESKVPAAESNDAKQNLREKYLKFFKLREEDGEYIQDVTEMTRVPVILKTDLSKSPPCLTIRSLNPYAL